MVMCLRRVTVRGMKVTEDSDFGRRQRHLGGQ